MQDAGRLSCGRQMSSSAPITLRAARKRQVGTPAGHNIPQPADTFKSLRAFHYPFILKSKYWVLIYISIRLVIPIREV